MDTEVLVPQFAPMKPLTLEQCTTLLNAAPMAIIYLDARGQRIYANPRYAQILNLSAEEMQSGVGGSKYLHPEDLARVMREWYDAFEKEDPFVSEYRVQHSDGRIEWVQARLDVIRGADGKVTHWTGVLVEITDRKRVENEVRESEMRLKLLIEQVPASVWTTDTELRFTSSTEYPRVRPMYTKSQLLGLPLASILVGRSPADAETVLSSHQRALKGERVVSEGPFQDFYFQSRIDPLRNAEGQIIGTIGVALDVTAHRNSQAKLRETQERLELIFKQLPAVLWTTDRDLRFTSTTGYAATTPQITVDSSIASTMHEVMHGTGDVGEMVLAANKKALEGEVVSYEVPFRGRWFGTTLRPLRSSDGEIVGTLGLALDITERREAEQVIREAHSRLEERVIERTSALSEANAALEQEATERAKLVEALRAGEQRYAGMLNAQQTLVARANLKYELIYRNAAYARALNVDLGHPITESIHPDDRDTTLAALESLKNPPHVAEFENRRWIDKSWHWVHWQFSVIRDRFDAIEEFQAVGFDVTERHIAEQSLRQSEEHYRELADANARLLLELDHRVRNNVTGLLSLVSAMRKRCKSVDEFASAMRDRLTAMDHNQQTLSSSRGGPVQLVPLLKSLLSAIHSFACAEAVESLSGPDVEISAEKTPALSMILFEWLTNSCKYGAHSSKTGHLFINWTIQRRESVDWLCLHWSERGGPPVGSELKPSLGTELIQGFATRELAGRVEMSFPPDGAQHLLEFPLD